MTDGMQYKKTPKITSLSAQLMYLRHSNVDIIMNTNIIQYNKDCDQAVHQSADQSLALLC